MAQMGIAGLGREEWARVGVRELCCRCRDDMPIPSLLQGAYYAQRASISYPLSSFCLTGVAANARDHPSRPQDIVRKAERRAGAHNFEHRGGTLAAREIPDNGWGVTLSMLLPWKLKKPFPGFGQAVPT